MKPANQLGSLKIFWTKRAGLFPKVKHFVATICECSAYTPYPYMSMLRVLFSIEQIYGLKWGFGQSSNPLQIPNAVRVIFCKIMYSSSIGIDVKPTNS
ncbi:hypothetical protein DAI22_09g008300 [Oryza sativa Japonica Group]|nr:hypothetical protein DAI22_09g008300 [Oryza sativa Japonica Group]